MSSIITAIKLRSNILWIFLFLTVILYTTSVYAQSILAPHMAEYTLKMTNHNTGSPLNNINGTMSYTIDDECNNWSVTQNFRLFYLYNNKNTVTEEKYFTSWEAKNGSSLQFASKSFSNNILSEVLRGAALKEKVGNGEVIFSSPENLNLKINNNTIFPNQYILEILKQAEKGERFFNKTMFDGSNKKGAIEINSFIGEKILIKGIEGLNNNKKIDKKLLGKYAWKIRMAFFPVDKKNSLPSHEIDLILHNNGVVSSAIVAYKGFSISENIQALSIRPKQNC